MLTLARAYERLGEPPKALEAARRRGYTFASGAFLSSFLREEGRLAAIVGDTAGAVKAYRHYLALRSDAEPAVKPEVARIHAELQKLDRASTDRARMERQ